MPQVEGKESAALNSGAGKTVKLVRLNKRKICKNVLSMVSNRSSNLALP